MLFFLLDIKKYKHASWQQSLVEDRASSQTLQNFNHFFNTDFLCVLEQDVNAQEKQKQNQQKCGENNCN